MSYRAIVARGPGPASLETLEDAELPDGDVTVAVAYSSLNYKDGLSVTGRGKVIRSYPMVCGVDLAGTVTESRSPRWHVGDEVLVTGFGLSETHPGGFSERQRVRSEWIVARPEGLTLQQTMAIGTAGLTAMLCVLTLERAGVEPSAGREVLVTGAAGGVGSIAVAILARLGHNVAAATGRPETADYLRELGARTIVPRAELALAARPLEHERWAAAIDSVGGQTLATVLAQTASYGHVAACGLAGGAELPATVMPFILRAVTLHGVESVRCPLELREQAWARLAHDLPEQLLAATTTLEPLERVPALAEEILAGRTRGRVVIDVGGTTPGLRSGRGALLPLSPQTRDHL